ncbi:MAG: hypothetical protein GYA55_13930, partial [SAR324 cluster bacterium]|nr:hypothetical protein [SAR324 cluster bacterium]
AEILNALAKKALYGEESQIPGAELDQTIRVAIEEFISVFKDLYLHVPKDTRRDVLEMFSKSQEAQSDPSHLELLWFEIKDLPKPQDISEEDWSKEKGNWKDILGITD